MLHAHEHWCTMVQPARASSLPAHSWSSWEGGEGGEGSAEVEAAGSAFEGT